MANNPQYIAAAFLLDSCHNKLYSRQTSRTKQALKGKDNLFPFYEFHVNEARNPTMA